MIIATSKSDTICNRALGKKLVITTTLEKISEYLPLDPTTSNPKRDLYVVTNEDISSPKKKQLFEQAVACKHPMAKILFINKSSRPIYADNELHLDAVVQKPRPDDITNTVSKLMSTVPVAASERSKSVDIPEYEAPVEQEYTENDFEETEPVVQQQEVLEVQPVEAPAEEPEPVDRPSNLIERIKRAGNVGDVSVIARELTATALVKDIVESNATYAGVEQKLKSLQDVIMSIFADPAISSIEDKLSRIRAVLHDKAFFMAKGDTIIEQHIEDIVETVCTRTQELITSRLAEIDNAISRSIDQKSIDDGNIRLQGITSERANIIIELQTMELELNDIFKSLDNALFSSADKIAKDSDTLTESDGLNALLEQRGAVIKPEEAHAAITKLLSKASNEIPDLFTAMKISIRTMQQLLNKLLGLDTEQQVAQEQLIRFLRSKDVEGTVVANTLLKKAMRVYTGISGTGRTIVSYLISQYKSRQGKNVLLVDVSGESKLDDYGINYMDVNAFIDEPRRERFLCVAGSVDKSISRIQQLLSTLIKAADFYETINIVINPEDIDIMSAIAPDCLSVNFITDTNNRNLSLMKDYLEKYRFENTAVKLWVNKCDVGVKAILNKLGLEDRIDYRLYTISSVPSLIDASLNKYDPALVSSVCTVFDEVVKHA